MRTARGPLLLGHATLGPEPWGSPRPPTSSRSASPVSSPAPPPRSLAHAAPAGPRPALVPPPLQEDERGLSALLPCHLTTLATETHILSTACRALGHWALLTPTRFSTRPHPPARPPCRGFWARRAGSPTLLPHTAGVGVAGRLPRPQGSAQAGPLPPGGRHPPPTRCRSLPRGPRSEPQEHFGHVCSPSPSRWWPLKATSPCGTRNGLPRSFRMNEWNE